MNPVFDVNFRMQREEAQPKEAPYAYVNRYYGLSVKPGMRVTMYGHRPIETGVVVRKRSYDHRVHVRFDGQTFNVPIHPSDLKYEDSVPLMAPKQENGPETSNGR